MKRLHAKLDKFASQHEIRRKGALSLVLVITRKASISAPPYSPENFLTPAGGQVAGLGRGAVKAILADHGVSRILAEEGGRTSRGNIERMRAYIALLNELAAEGMLDFDAIERWWIGCVIKYFATKPFKLKVDSSRSLRSIVTDLIDSAFVRQRECPGTMFAGAMIQHLVGAKLELALPEVGIRHNGFAVADAPGGRKGDFLIGDTAIHVTTAPSEALIVKCCANLAENLRPLVITTGNGAGGAFALAKNADVADRIDILEIDQFVATNVLERSGFKLDQRPVKVRELIDCYNRIIDKCETDPSLKIAVG